MARPTVLIAERLAQAPAQWLGERAALIWAQNDPATLQEHLPEADALIVRTYTTVTAELLDQAPKLKVVGRAGVGLDNVDLQACRERGIQVVYTPDANTQAVVEYVFALMFDALRPRVGLDGPTSPEQFHALRKANVGKQIEELTLGIVGFGRIGRRVGEVAYALGMNLTVCDLLPESQVRKAVRFPFEYLDHESLYAHSDIVTLHVDGRASNRGLIDAQALARFRDNAMLVNTSRGFVIDSEALAQWAKEHPEGQAILDVHEPEPPPEDYPLWNLPNVRLMPHLAARTHRAMANMSWVVHDVVAVLEGRRPENPAPDPV
jgi:phosphoglycerate dehydrogenase-like enzyme